MTNTVAKCPDWHINIYEDDREILVCGRSYRYTQPTDCDVNVHYWKSNNSSVTHRNRVAAMLHVVRDLLANEHDALWLKAKVTTHARPVAYLTLTIEDGGVVVAEDRDVKKTEEVLEGAIV